MSAADLDRTPASPVRAGLAASASAYTLWGLLPLYLTAVSFAPLWEVVAWRVLWSVPALAGFLLLIGGVAETRAALRNRAVLGGLCLSSAFIAANWASYMWTVAAGRVIEASLAYFIAPLVSVLMGVFFFRERLTPGQAIALVLALAGVIVQTAALGHPPYAALVICATWSLYALVRKQTAAPAAGGLLIETAMLAPLAIAGFIAAGLLGAPIAFDDGWREASLLTLAGPVTAAPLALFAFGARRLRFATIGLLQFIAPSLQFAVGVALGEPVGALRLLSFVLIWTGLAAFSYDVWRRERKA